MRINEPGQGRLNADAFTIRGAEESDIEQLTHLERASFKSYYSHHRFTREQFRYYLKNPRAITHVVVRDVEVVGYSLGIQMEGGRRHIVRLHSIAIRSEFRNRGLADRLLAAFLREARRRGCHIVYLEVADRNQPAVHLFRKKGFVPVRRLPGYYSSDVSGIRMRRAL